MTLTEQGKLSIVVLVCFTPLLIPTAFLLKRHGFRKQTGWMGWVYLFLVPVFRIVGPSLELAADAGGGNSRSLRAASLAFASIGLVPLIFAIIGILERIVARMSSTQPIYAKLLRWFDLLALVSTILSIIATTRLFSSDPEKVMSGLRLNQGSSVLLLIAFALAAVMLLFSLLAKRHVAVGDLSLLYTAGLSVPFLFVRMAYSIGRAFGYNTLVFNRRAPNVFGSAFLQYLPELVVVILLVFGGLRASIVDSTRASASPTESSGTRMTSQQSRESSDKPVSNQAYDRV